MSHLLTVSQTSSAIFYNRRQGFTQRQVELVQATVGANVDGSWGSSTVAKVASWQKAHGLSVDGKVGPRTMESIEESNQCVRPARMPSRVEIGCGLAAYDQRFSGLRPEQAMRLAFDAAVGEGVHELRYWSSEWIIEDLGAKGNSYAEGFLRGLQLPPDVEIGTWIDDPIYVVKKPVYAQRLVQANISTAALMINKSNTRSHQVPWALRYRQEDLRAVADNLQSHGIKIACTTWPQPSKSQIDVMCEDMEWVLKVCHAVEWEVDTEMNWDESFLDGFRTLAEAADYLAKRMRTVAQGRRLGLTTFTFHRENSGRAVLAPLMDVLFPQGYSVVHRDDGRVEAGDLLGPGRHQRLAVGRARQAAAA